MKTRCAWLDHFGKATELDIKYHDEEWGVPIHDDRLLFEFLILEGAQAGLSWTTILKKREQLPQGLRSIRTRKSCKYTEAKQQKLLLNPGIVRNRLKVAAFRQQCKSVFKSTKRIWQFRCIYLEFRWQTTPFRINGNQWRKSLPRQLNPTP